MGKKYQVRYLPSAEKDFMEIIEYIRADNPTAAMNFIDQIDETISQLELFPMMGQIPKERRLQSQNYRMLIIGNYLVFYSIKGNIVEIRRILHGKRRYFFLFDPK
ncbi:type II toxin-antitoxin system RelE/ParE family toxin [Phosphitispora fastidiosa]|uniref:type II toxin-antitoxin system RelE/ParE family toxin n=1 Tax=Phosphitispora fastidiosa TaxID=2837202 RepID=UPI001E3373A6|nr:type II toxin-antitoxin system RelE/ParE family toxin [Phosphitispora fastidiosa]